MSLKDPSFFGVRNIVDKNSCCSGMECTITPLLNNFSISESTNLASLPCNLVTGLSHCVGVLVISIFGSLNNA